MSQKRAKMFAGLALAVALGVGVAYISTRSTSVQGVGTGRADSGTGTNRLPARIPKKLPSIIGLSLVEQARHLDRWLAAEEAWPNPEVRQLLRSGPVGIKLRCLQYVALAKDKAALKQVRALGGHADLRVRLSALGARRDLSDFSDMGQWVKALSSKDPEEVMQGAFGISMSHRRQHIPALVPLLKSPHRAVRIETAFAFAELHWKKASKMFGQWAYTRDYLQQEAGIFAWLYDPDEDVALDKLTELMWSPDEKLADLAIHLIPRIKSPRVVKICKQARRSPHRLVRMWAVFTLRKLGTRDAVAALSVFKDDPSSSVQHFLTAKSIKGLDEPRRNIDAEEPPSKTGQGPPSMGNAPRYDWNTRDLSGLMKDLSSRDYFLRSQAIEFLDKRYYKSLDNQGFKRLARLEKDPAPKVRKKALEMITRQRRQGMLPLLLRMAEDPVAKVRQQAVFGLWRYPAPEALAGIRKALKDGSMDVRMVALLALARHRSPNLPAPVVAAARHADFSMRAAAMHALGHVKSSKVVPLLVAGMGDVAGWVRLNATYALRGYKAPAACAALGRALGDPSYYVRAVALESSALACPEEAARILALGGAAAARYEPMRSKIKTRRAGAPVPSEIPFIKLQCAHEYLSHTYDQIEGFTPLGRPKPGPLDID